MHMLLTVVLNCQIAPEDLSSPGNLDKARDLELEEEIEEEEVEEQIERAEEIADILQDDDPEVSTVKRVTLLAESDHPRPA